MINVSWDDAEQYVTWLSSKTGKSYRLLTEAEWEYAARAVARTSASHGPFSTGATISTDRANYNGYGNSIYDTKRSGVHRKKTVEVGSFPGNAFALHDMHGNVWEWVQDCPKNYSGAPTDGSAVTSIDCRLRILRGGSWFDYVYNLRSANRIGLSPDTRNNNIGFRVARTL